MKTLMELAGEWRNQAAALSMGTLGTPLAARKLECADELEALVRDADLFLDRAGTYSDYVIRQYLLGTKDGE